MDKNFHPLVTTLQEARNEAKKLGVLKGSFEDRLDSVIASIALNIFKQKSEGILKSSKKEGEL